MQEAARTFSTTFHEGHFTVGLVHGPLTLAMLEPVDEVAGLEASDMTFPAESSGYQFYFASEYLHHLLSLATDPSIDNAVEVGILEARIALSDPLPARLPVRTVRIRTAVLGPGQSVEMAVGRVAEQPDWVPRRGAAAAGSERPDALQHLVRREDMAPFLLARSLHWIEIRPSRPGWALP